MPLLHPINADLTYLIKHKITAYRIAKCINVSANTLVHWQVGVFSPTPPNAAKLAALRQHIERYHTYKGFVLPNHKTELAIR